MKIFLFKHQCEMLFVLAESQKEAEEQLIKNNQAVGMYLEHFCSGDSFRVVESPWEPGFAVEALVSDEDIMSEERDLPVTWSDSDLGFYDGSRELAPQLRKKKSS